MKIDISLYKLGIPELKYRLDKSKPEDVCVFISEYASATHIPLLALCYFVKQLGYGTDKVDEKIEALKKFYKYTEVTGIE